MQPIIALAADHGGFALKIALLSHLQDMGLRTLDLGTNSATESVDYPDYAALLAAALKAGEAERGILICGSGIGISIAANRYPFLRCALVHDVTTARLAREHNDANVLALGERITGLAVAKDCVDIFLRTQFTGGRHEARVAKLTKPSCN
jgi:ribose 5-phosphate isomerase B